MAVNHQRQHEKKDNCLPSIITSRDIIYQRYSQIRHKIQQNNITLACKITSTYVSITFVDNITATKHLNLVTNLIHAYVTIASHVNT